MQARTVKEIDNFNLFKICNSGQCFRMWQMGPDTYAVIASGRYLEITQNDRECIFYCEEEEFQSFWQEYFDLGQDYGIYAADIDASDRYLVKAAGFGGGIRILRQDLWEMIVSFLISQQNNITRIRKCIQNICRQYGEKKYSPNGVEYNSFPTAAALAGASEEELKGCNLGYRSKYILRTAGSFASGDMTLASFEKLKYGEARKELQKLYGVGEKVADCICLFALHHLEAFPVDTHISQAVQKHYPEGFPKNRYKGYEGVIQQYIFYYELFEQQGGDGVFFKIPRPRFKIPRPPLSGCRARPPRSLSRG